ncbi:hypothetical protein SAMN04488090_0682 [Siphonobacter aquaeclarae]|uniref:Uncharacterized protein n=1 Tax=Siphonobacter aquaeclarae TaxID=563176 RepID=A0A1G9IZM3_9BACT|nr:hypothetical protein SAMN04488090_0682 [Siphonobacter aquaeclarae]
MLKHERRRDFITRKCTLFLKVTKWNTTITFFTRPKMVPIFPNPSLSAEEGRSPLNYHKYPVTVMTEMTPPKENRDTLYEN